MGCGASAAPPYEPPAEDEPQPVAAPPPAAPAPEPAPEPAAPPKEVEVGDGSGTAVQVAAYQEEDEGGDDAREDRGPILPFVRFDKSAVPKDVAPGTLVYLQLKDEGEQNAYLGSADGNAVNATELSESSIFAIERSDGNGNLKDGDGILLRHNQTGMYLDAASDQYPVTLMPRDGNRNSQIFRLFKQGRPLAVRHKDTVFLQSWLSNFVELTSTITGEACVVASRWRRSPNAHFTILKKEVLDQPKSELARKMQFQAFDMDGNGAISRAEMEYMMKLVQGGIAAEDLDKIMATYSENGKDSILYSGFVQFADNLQNEDLLQHAEALGNTAQRCNDALNEESALIEVLSCAHQNTVMAMKKCYSEKFPREDGGPGDMAYDIDGKTAEKDGWIFSNNWKLVMRALMENEVDLWCRCLGDAMDGWGTDEEALTYLVCTMPERLRQPIYKRFYEMYGKGLKERIESETSGHYKKVLVCQAMAPEDAKAKLLHDAMEGLGTDEKQLIRIITQCDIPERRQVKEAFQRIYKQDLMEWVKGDTSGNFRKALLCLLEATESQFNVEEDCEAMKKAMDGWGTDEAALIKLICNKTAKQMEIINEKFEELYGKRLIDRVSGETSSYFKQILLAWIKHPMEQLVDCVRETMKGWGTDETGLITMLCHLPDYKKEALIKQYRTQLKRDLVSDIKGDCSGNLEKALLALVRPAPRVWAEVLMRAMKGLGTSDRTLINVMCIAKDEMGEVRKGFSQVTEGESLVKWLEGDTSGDYKRCLAALANRNTEEDPLMVPIYWAQRGRDAVCNADTLKSILTSLPSLAIKRGSEVYQAVYGRSLEEEVRKKVEEGSSWFAWSNNYKQSLLQLLKMPVEMYVDGLHDAMKGIGTDESTLTALVCTIPENMYADIHTLYARKYGRSLLDAIKGDCSFAYKKAMVYQAADWPESRAMALDAALSGTFSTAHDQICRVMICTTRQERKRIMDAYKAMFSKGLIAHLEEDTTGPELALLVAILESNECTADCDFQWEDDCERLKQAVEGEVEDEDAVIRVIAAKSPEQIAMLLQKFKEKFDYDLYKRIEEDSELWNDKSKHFRALILGLLRPPLEALAYSVRDCIKGFGTDETGLVTCLVHLSERRKKDLVEAYKDVPFGGCIWKHIEGDCSGSFETAILALLKPAPQVWAEALMKAMKGLGTSDNLLINFLCVAKDRMDEVRAAFKGLTCQDLAQWIDGECGNNDYKDVLMRLANREVYRFAGSDAMVTTPPPPSQEMALYQFAKTFNRLIKKRKQAPGGEENDIIIPEEAQQEMANVFMFYGEKSSCSPNLDKQGVWDMTFALGFPPGDMGPDLTATFEEWDVSGTGEITWNDFVREMTVRVNDPNHYQADPLPENPPDGTEALN